MIDFDYAFLLLTEFLDCDIDDKYTDTWTLYNTGTSTFNVTTRTDYYGISDFDKTEWTNIGTGGSNYHTIDLNNIYKVEFENTEGTNQAEFWINCSASESTTLKISINGITHSISVDTTWKVRHFYTDDLEDDTNEMVFTLYTEGGQEIYIDNATTNSNLTFSKFAPLTGWESEPGLFAIDILFCDLIMYREVEKYSTDTKLQIAGSGDKDWNLIYYPSIYTQLSYVSVNFVLTTNDGDYLDNFTMTIQCETPQYVIISSNFSDLYFYRAEGNQEFVIRIFNSGEQNTSITSISSSLTWVNTTINDYFGALIASDSYYDFILYANPTTAQSASDYPITLTFTGTNNMTYTTSRTFFLLSRPSVAVTPLFIDRERDNKDVDESFSLTISNTGPGVAYISITFTDSEGFGAAQISLDNNVSSDFSLTSGESTIVWFTITGGSNDRNDSFLVYVKTYSDSNRSVLVDTDTVEVFCTTYGEKLNGIYVVLLIAMGISMLFLFFMLSRLKKKDRELLEEIEYYDPNKENNIHANLIKYRAAKAKYEKNKKLRSRLSLRWVPILFAFMFFVSAVWLVWTGEAYNPFDEIYDPIIDVFTFGR
jgi:hypothetical protein